jgi:DNA-binding LacI/PurR family transcriptional regulator
MLWMTSHHEGASAFVLSGNIEIGRLGAKYCFEKKCQYLVAVSSVLGAEVYKSRHQSFVETAKKMGMESSLVMGGPAETLEESVKTAIANQIGEIEKADAIFFPSDRTAAFAYPILHRNGIFSKTKNPVVLSCGGEKSYLTGLDPRPVSIDMGAELIGQQAVEQIIWKIRHPNQARRFSVVIHPEIIE